MIDRFDCPECEGHGYFEKIAWLTWDGDVSYRYRKCERCGGEGYVTELKADEIQEDGND